jgi:hypothetical protein
MCKTWRRQYYSYIHLDKIPQTQFYDILEDIELFHIFLYYSNNTTKYIKVDIQKLRYNSWSCRVIIDMANRGGDLHLRWRNCIARLQETQNMVVVRKPEDRPKIENPIDPIST